MPSKQPAQEQIKEYIEQAKKYPLKQGQLLEMVVLHFNIPQKVAEKAIWEVINAK